MLFLSDVSRFRLTDTKLPCVPGSVAFGFVGLWVQTLADQAKCASTTSTSSLHPALTPRCRPAQPPPRACKSGICSVHCYHWGFSSAREGQRMDGWIYEWMIEKTGCWSWPNIITLVKHIGVCGSSVQTVDMMIIVIAGTARPNSIQNVKW